MTDASGRGVSVSPVDVVVAGYASIDRVWHADRAPAPGLTAILHGAVHPAPSWGGCGPNVALALARLGVRAGIVSWLGDDADGRAYLEVLETAGVEVTCVEVASGEASPHTILVYDPNGSATCLYHPSGSREQVLGPGARAVASSAPLLALTVGPSRLTYDLLEARGAATRLAWSVKADADAYPPTLRDRLLQEADIVCMNRDELEFVAGADLGGRSRETTTAALLALPIRGSAVAVVTLGADGCLLRSGGEVHAIHADRVEVVDPTGAGDSFFAALVAALLSDSSAPDAARAATAHAASYLRGRAASRPAAKGMA
jgi:ribokinase